MIGIYTYNEKINDLEFISNSTDETILKYWPYLIYNSYYLNSK